MRVLYTVRREYWMTETERKSSEDTVQEELRGTGSKQSQDSSVGCYLSLAHKLIIHNKINWS